MARHNAALLLLAVTTAANGDWAIRSTGSENGRAGVSHEHVVLENSSATDTAVVDLALFFTTSCTLRVIDNRTGEPLSQTMASETLVAGVNGGYFDPNFAPIGLLISGGALIAPLQRARLMTGVIVASERGMKILRVREFSRNEKATAAVQCGPFLVDHHEAVHGLNSSQKARRTFAATGTSDRAWVGVSSELSLAELGAILATVPFDQSKIQRALNLDGGSSSAFWFARENGRPFSIPEEKPVRDFVAVLSK